MATMKDVARLAGVSHGTVSNVINGSKSVSSDKIRRVEQAMAQLGYKPNALARNLKTNRTGRIEVVLPDISNPAYAKIFEEIDRHATEKGYKAYLRVCGDVPSRECEILENALMMGTDGVILLTCQPTNTEFFNRLIDGGLPIVFIHRKVTGYRMNNADLNVRARVAATIGEQIAAGFHRIAIVTGPQEYSFEMECMDAYFSAMQKARKNIDTKYVETVNCNKESAMRAAIRLMELENPPQVIFTTDRVLYEGVACALAIGAKPKLAKTKLIALDAEEWTKVKGERERTLPLPYTQMARCAFDLLVEIVTTKDKKGGRSISVHCTERYGLAAARCHDIGACRKIRVLTQDSPSSHTLKSLAVDFKRSTGIDLELKQVPYNQMLDEVLRGVPAGEYDVFTMDLPWMKELILGGYVQDLTEFYPDQQALEAMFSQDVLREHCFFDDRLYALPFSYTVQLLFYRKDLFENIKYKRLYYERFKQDLKVPETWEEYNRIAKFFTRKYNLDSETIYGTTLGAMNAVGAVCEYLPRAWAEGGAIFENSKVVIDSDACVKALTQYMESFDYASPDSPAHWWDEQVEIFARGDAAMMVMYSDHATPLEDRSISNVVGKVGFALLPGRVSVLGGWSIGVSAYSDKKSDAFEFVKWTAAESLMFPNAMLGRIVPYRAVLESSELHNLYPWYRVLPEAFSCTKRRAIPRNSKGESVSYAIMERIIGNAVHAALDQRMTPREALCDAARKLSDAIK
ncbi:MAG: extracellular solute-binding protein [Christensenellaceae bacterium]|nr:extracellular solute-binding protein [Christensenellaceae bacterium]